MKKYILTTALLISSLTFAQDTSEVVTENQKRVLDINDLISRIEVNRSTLSRVDEDRINDYLRKVDKRKKMLADAKWLLTKENNRNLELEQTFADYEKELAELETELNLKLGVLGELFGVARQMAGELKADTDDSFNFSENINRSNRLNEIGKVKVHSLTDLEDLWLLHLTEIASSGEVKKINTNIINRDGDLEESELTRFGPFNMVKGKKFVKTDIANNAYRVLSKQPERSVTSSFNKHEKSDSYKVAAIDPTRGFLLSLYLDKPSTFERVAQGKTIGFIIVLIGVFGILFSFYRFYNLYIYSKELESNDSLNVYKNIDKLSSENSNIENLERQLDELLLTISGKLSWGVNWIKFLAAVAPLLGLLGTVIGMIETFQAITVFGTGDPKQMAGGISQALVTTMLGLIFAAPLLGMYTLLSEKISEILQKIEEHVALVLAKKAG
jgi:biopolymer transport protein ExbB|tara:strand:- start:1026 stop:2354 length:1329 start_codon:yes stop_codon:yes gene_type:complete